MGMLSLYSHRQNNLLSSSRLLGFTQSVGKAAESVQ